MKKIKFTWLPVMTGMISIVFAMASCKSGTGSTETVADSIQAKTSLDSAVTMRDMKEDSSKSAMMMEGKAKANPAKKHGKGKVVFQSDREANYEKENETIVIAMDKEGIYNRAEIKPSFPGGQQALAKFIQDNIVYPDAAIDNGVEATVDVVFAVDEAGKVYTPRLRNEKEGYGLDEASLNVVSKMPKWNPGQIKGKNVKSYYTLPISFVIQ